jgi:hypothetical protein
LLALCGCELALAPFASLIACGGTAPAVAQNPGGAPFQWTDKQLLDEIQKGSFEFFWNETNPQTAQVKDRAFLNGKDTRKMASIAATGFGLTSLCIGDARGYAAHGEILERVRVAIAGKSDAHGAWFLLALRGYGQRAARGKVRTVFHGYFPAALRNLDGARVFSGRGNSGPGHENLQSRGMAVDAERRPNIFDGLHAGVGFPRGAKGTLLRTDDLPAGNRFADESSARRDMEGVHHLGEGFLGAIGSLIENAGPAAPIFYGFADLTLSKLPWASPMALEDSS